MPLTLLDDGALTPAGAVIATLVGVVVVASLAMSIFGVVAAETRKSGHPYVGRTYKVDSSNHSDARTIQVVEQEANNITLGPDKPWDPNNEEAQLARRPHAAVTMQDLPRELGTLGASTSKIIAKDTFAVSFNVIDGPTRFQLPYVLSTTSPDVTFMATIVISGIGARIDRGIDIPGVAHINEQMVYPAVHMTGITAIWRGNYAGESGAPTDGAWQTTPTDDAAMITFSPPTGTPVNPVTRVGGSGLFVDLWLGAPKLNTSNVSFSGHVHVTVARFSK